MKFNRLIFSIVISFVFLFANGISNADVYQWTDEQGTTHFSDKSIEGKTEKVDIDVLPKHEKEKAPVASVDNIKNESDAQKNNDKSDSSVTNKKVKAETPAEKAIRERTELTDELIKAREIREAERKKQKTQEQVEIIQCQEEKTKLALMENELKEYDEIMKSVSRSDRTKSNEYIRWSDLNVRINRQRDITYDLCN